MYPFNKRRRSLNQRTRSHRFVRYSGAHEPLTHPRADGTAMVALITGTAHPKPGRKRTEDTRVRRWGRCSRPGQGRRATCACSVESPTRKPRHSCDRVTCAASRSGRRCSAWATDHRSTAACTSYPCARSRGDQAVSSTRSTESALVVRTTRAPLLRRTRSQRAANVMRVRASPPPVRAHTVNKTRHGPTR
jgi:hypothetical protein